MTRRSLRLEAGDRHRRRQARHRDHAVVVGDRDDVVAVGRVDDDRVRLAVAGARARSILTSLTSVLDRSLTVMVSAPPRAWKSIVSTSSRSIVTLATSRVSRTCPPLAEMSIFSAMLAPLNSSVSVPAWPSTVSLSSPGFQTNVSSPAPSKARSLPSPPLTRSLPSLPMIVSSPRPPLIVSLIWPACERRWRRWCRRRPGR